jgi:hypothetical protein
VRQDRRAKARVNSNAELALAPFPLPKGHTMTSDPKKAGASHLSVSYAGVFMCKWSRFAATLLLNGWAWANWDVGKARADDRPAVTVIQDAPMTIDPLKSTAVGVIRVRRPAATNPAKIDLSVGDFISSTTDRFLNARTTLSTTRPAVADDASRITVEWGDQNEREVYLLVSNLGQQASQADAEVYDGTTPIGKITAVRNQVPFGIRVAGSGDSVALRFVEGEPTYLTLVNGDAVDYPVQWDLNVGGKSKRSTALVRAFGSVRIPVSLDSDEFPNLFENAMKPATRDGTLVIGYQPIPDGAVGPVKTFPVQAQLSAWGPSAQALLSAIAIMVLLLAGAFGSIFITQIVPISIRRRHLQDQIRQLIGRSATLAKNGQSSVRSLIRVECRRLREALQACGWYRVDVQTLLAEAEREIGVNSERIDLLREIDEVQEGPRPCQNASPKALREIADLLAGAVVLLSRPGPTPTVLAEARIKIGHARAKNQALTDIDDESKDKLRKRREALSAELKPYSTAADGMLSKVPRLLRLVTEPAIDPTTDDDWVRHEYDLERLGLVAQFVRTYATRTDPKCRELLDKAWVKLVRLLNRDGPEALRAAGLLACQVREGMYAEKLLEILRQDPYAAKIVVLPVTPQTFDQAVFSLVFQDRSKNTCAAREALICSWSFSEIQPSPDVEGDVGAGIEVKPWQERAKGWWKRSTRTLRKWRTRKKLPDDPEIQGWSVPHYFNRPGHYGVTVALLDPLAADEGASSKPYIYRPLELSAKPNTRNNDAASGSANSAAASEPSKRITVVRKFGANGIWRSLLEAGRFMLLLLVALGALLVGAREQVLKLDPIAAALAIIAIGYGANGIKNLFSQPGAGDDKSAPPPSSGPATPPPPPRPKPSGGPGATVLPAPKPDGGGAQMQGKDDPARIGAGEHAGLDAHVAVPVSQPAPAQAPPPAAENH